MRRSILVKLLAVYFAPTLALAVLAPLLGWAVARSSLEREVGRRLVTAAAAAATAMRADLLATLQPGDEGTRTYRNLLTRLEAMRAAAAVQRLAVFDPQRRLLLGTGEARPIGTPLPELERDRSEVEGALLGAPTASVAFVGLDGRTYLSGYAPVADADGKVVAAVMAEASADFFRVPRQVGGSMLAVAIAVALAGLALFGVAANRWLLRPLRSLRAAAKRIGAGDLASPVPVPVGKDELAVLAQTLEQMRAQLSARESETQMMLAGIAHEVRNPLGGIELFAGLLAEDLRDRPEQLEYVRRVQRELGHLSRVVEDFLGYARDAQLQRATVSAAALLNEVAQLAQAEAGRRQVQVVVEAADLVFEADAAAIRRALINLVRNALEASPEEGTVRLAARKGNGRVVLSVEDEGPGVPAELRDRLFTPFFTTREKGLGLGLALVRRIAEAHGGRAFLDERGPGARFVLELPETSDRATRVEARAV